MNPKHRADLENYLTAMAQAKKMLTMGILTPKDYSSIDTIIAKKYNISSFSLYRGMDLIYRSAGGNMSHNEEVT